VNEKALAQLELLRQNKKNY